MRNGRSSAAGRGLAVLLAAWVAVTAAPGCAARGAYDVYRDDQMDFGMIRTVAIMPLVNLTKDENAAERVRDVLFTMLMASSGIYVVPAGEAARGLSMTGVAMPGSPTSAEVVKLAAALKADAVITGVVKEYGEIRSAGSSASMISVSFRMMEGANGRIVWNASSTQGGVGMKDRLLGGGGVPMNVITEKAIDDILEKLFK